MQGRNTCPSRRPWPLFRCVPHSAPCRALAQRTCLYNLRRIHSVHTTTNTRVGGEYKRARISVNVTELPGLVTLNKQTNNQARKGDSEVAGKRKNRTTSTNSRHTHTGTGCRTPLADAHVTGAARDGWDAWRVRGNTIQRPPRTHYTRICACVLGLACMPPHPPAY